MCWVFVSVRGLSLVAASRGHSSSRCAGLSLSRPLPLWSTGSRRAGSVVVAHGPSCSVACGIFPDQGSNPCPLYWQVDSQPLHHQGSPLIISLFRTRVLPWGSKPLALFTRIGLKKHWQLVTECDQSGSLLGQWGLLENIPTTSKRQLNDGLSMKIINKQSIIGIEKNFIWAEWRTIAWETACWITLRSCSGEAWFSAQFYILSEQRTSNRSQIHSFKVSKKPDQHVHSESVWPWHLGRESYRQKSEHWCPRKGGISSLSLTRTFFTSGQCTLFFDD